MRIIVKYNNSYYFWVDTVVMHDEYDYTFAILISSNGSAFPVCIDKITVVDDDYNHKKYTEKEANRLDWENFMLQEQEKFDAEVSKHRNPIIKGERQ